MTAFLTKVHSIIEKGAQTIFKNLTLKMLKRCKYDLLSFQSHCRAWYLQTFLSQSERETLAAMLQSTGPLAEVKVLITIPVRKLGNPHCFFDHFLRDFLTHTANPEDVLLFIAVDEDDDLPFYLKLKEQYQQSLNIRFFVSGEKSGYQGTLNLHVKMLELNTSGFLAWVLGSSDMQPCCVGWDVNLLSAINEHSGALFVGGGPEERAGIIHGPFPEDDCPVYWVGTDDYPIASKTLLDILFDYENWPDGWTPIGCSWHIDGFFGELIRHLFQIERQDIFLKAPQIFIERDPRGWLGNKDRESLRNSVLTSFFELDKQMVMSKLAQKISAINPVREY